MVPCPTKAAQPFSSPPSTSRLGPDLTTSAKQVSPGATAECDVQEVEPGVWQMTPKADLKPGEYGLLFRGGFLGTLAATQGELFDFGVD